MTIADLSRFMETIAPLSLQEDYDNAGLLCGDPLQTCTGILCALDVTEAIIHEAVSRKCNCIVAHHPFIFRGLKQITTSDPVQRTVIAAVKNNVAVYAAHTNMDNVIHGVNKTIADQLQLTGRKVLAPKGGSLKKLFTFVPESHIDAVREALFSAGAGNISDYTECSFSAKGVGTFRPGENTHPFTGERGKRQEVNEIRLEVILPAYKERELLQVLNAVHPYEELAYDLVSLDNIHQGTGSGLLGKMTAVDEADFLEMLRTRFGAKLVRHSPLTGKKISRVAVCGGAGSFLISRALAAGADAFVTADLKYHEFFGADGKMLLCDIGHFESEQYTIDLFHEILLRKFPTFAVLKSGVKTNPVNYYTGK